MDVESMTRAAQLRHALVLAEGERPLGAELRVERLRPTALRGPIALSDEGGLVFARGQLSEVGRRANEGGGRLTRYEWTVTEIEPFEQPFLARAQGVGPVWVRLGVDDRARAERNGADDAVSVGMRTDVNVRTEVMPLPPAEEPLKVPEGDNDFDFAGLAPLAEVAEPDASESKASDYLDAEKEGGSEPAFNVEAPSLDKADGTLAAASPAGEGRADVVELPEDSKEHDAKALPGESFLAQARERALAFVPKRTLTEEAARQLLIQLRETEIKATFPEIKPTAGILRKTLLDRMIDEAIESEEDFVRLIPRDVRLATDSRQLAAYLDPILQILSKVR